MTKTSIVITSITVGILIFMMLTLSDRRAETAGRVSDCVAYQAQAQEQGYRGNPYGQEAWELFADSCK